MTIAMLSWGYHDTLINTLDSYYNNGLLDLDDEKVIFFQEYSDRDRRIAKEFGFDSFGSPENIGIAEAYKLLATYASGEFFLFLENDWKLLEPAQTAILDGRAFLRNSDMADIVRYRHRDNPGHPLWTRQFEGREYDRPTHLLDSIHWTDPSKFPEIHKSKARNGTQRWQPVREWFFTTSKYANWTNNPHMARTEFIQEFIAPRMGDGDGERAIQSWWEKQDFRVAQGRGLFTHYRTS